MSEIGTKRCPVEFDHESAAHAQAWPQDFQNIRSRCPVAWTESHGGYWVATAYHDIIRIAQDDATFTNGKSVDPHTGEMKGGIIIPPLLAPRAIPDETDRPEWEGFRKLLNRRFAPKAAEERRAKAKIYATALLDRVIETGKMDLVHDLTSPLPSLVTMDLLGFPLDEWRRFADPLHEMVYTPNESPDFMQVMDKVGWVFTRIREEMAGRKKKPQDDLISYLVTAEIGGAPIADNDIESVIFNLFAGGADTTGSLSSNVFLHLYQNPAEKQRLIENPAMISLAREEFVRYFSPIHGLARSASRDVNIGDSAIEKGDRILLAYSAGNRDPKVFDSPDEVILDRFPNRHIGFGAGMHRCIGSFVARMMFETMLEEVLDRIPNYEIDVENARPYTSVGKVNGWINMPASFEPGKRRGERMSLFQ
jgi:cytochrome P450